jgi:2-octaprenyl-6-methoxyphenol hydroxylase
MQVDIAIVGGGMVGASLAIALQHTNLTIGLIEAFPLKTDSQPSYDDRGIALSYGSQRIFESMGLWSAIAPFTTAIEHIHVSDRGHFGVTRLSAEDEGVPALGQVLTAKALGHTLNNALQSLEGLHLFCPAQVTDISQHHDHVALSMSDGATVKARLVVAADGRESTIRKQLNISALEQSYGQTAVTANVTTDQPHQGWAYERFTDTGPLALLPLSEQRSSLVWTVKTGDETALLDCSEDAFLQTLQHRFGFRAGRFTRVGQRNSHPLTLMQADSPQQHRVVLIGNASHSLHPIAGQGFNLGLRDVAVLADLICQHLDDPGSAELLFDYQQWRNRDQQQVINTTNHLVTLFSNAVSPLGHARGAGLTLMDLMPSAKHQLAKRSMGLNLKQPRLGRGMNL